MDKVKTAVVYISSDLYSRLACTSIYSLCANNQNEDFDIYLISMGILAENREKIESVTKNFHKSIFFIDGTEIEGQIITLKLPPYFGSYNIYVRPMVTEIIDKKYDVAVYMDCDTIINRSLNMLIKKTFNLPDNKVVIMARNSDNGRVKKLNGMDENDIAVNPGVMFINCLNWRNKNCTEKILNYFKTHDISQYKTLDEPVYGNVLKGHIEAAEFHEIYYPCFGDFSGKQLLFMFGLDEKNYYSVEEIEQAKGNEVVLHYVNILGHPWESNCKAPLSDIWTDYYELTPWGGGQMNLLQLPAKNNFTRKFALFSYGISKWLFVIIMRLYLSLSIRHNKRNDGI